MVYLPHYFSFSFQSITALKYYLQTTLDSLEDSRKSLLDGLMEIDNRMGNPRVEDIERVRYCPNCYSGDGDICVHCELDELFQVIINSSMNRILVCTTNSVNVIMIIISSPFSSHILYLKVYEARLFRLNKGNHRGLIPTAEEAVDLQKKKSALNQFYWKLSQAGKSSTSDTVRTEDEGKKRDAGEKLVVSELVLSIFCLWAVVRK